MARQGELARRRTARALALLGASLALGAVTSACATKPHAAVVPAAPAPTTDTAAGLNDEETDDTDTSGAMAEAEGESPIADPARAPSGPCPVDMVLVTSASVRVCVDKYEASLVEVMPDGTEKPFAHFVSVDGHDVRAVSKAHVFPQGFISEVQAQDACGASGKRLCKLDEWKTACMGPSHTTFPYGDARRPGACHDTGKSAVAAVFGAKAMAASTPVAPSAPAPVTASHGKRAHVTKGRAAQSSHARVAARGGSKPALGGKASAATKKTKGRTGKKSQRPASVDPGVWAHLNDPALGQVDGALAKTGEHEQCVNDFGVYDMVGNIHEWVQGDPASAHGTFSGGYYLDTALNGDGCNYKTTAHAHDYHDYSTGFRCCAEPSE